MVLDINWAKILPVIISIGIILSIAILREYSRTLAAIAAVMPINVPLSMWIVSSGEKNSQAALTDFTYAMMINLLPLFIFLIVAWQMTKAGFSLIPTILMSYLIWAIGIGIIYLLQRWLAT